MVTTDPAAIWHWLEAIPDPELPSVSVVDLGIVREVAWRGAELAVAITPTYSGCPAQAVIAREIERTLHEHGIEQVQLETRLTPPWSSDWVTARGREQLQAAGIAPPAGLVNIAAPVACPRCGSPRTECIAGFSSTACKALYRCGDCREPFDYFKPHG
ncbi:MAG: 1,2-phenylacetyl-CoA epoxidase subunit PaaD [Terriglobales bacterium]